MDMFTYIILLWLLTCVEMLQRFWPYENIHDAIISHYSMQWIDRRSFIIYWSLKSISYNSLVANCCSIRYLYLQNTILDIAVCWTRHHLKPKLLLEVNLTIKFFVICTCSNQNKCLAPSAVCNLLSCGEDQTHCRHIPCLYIKAV